MISYYAEQYISSQKPLYLLISNIIPSNYSVLVRNLNTSLAAKGALAHRLQRLTACNAAPPATPHRLQNPKWPPVGPKMADRVWAF